MTHDDETRLRRFLDRAHETLDPPPPTFETVLEGAWRRQARPLAPRLAFAGAALAVAVALTVILISNFGGRRDRTALSPDEALLLAESFGGWRAPTDFLQRPPGAELYEHIPSFFDPPSTWVAEVESRTPKANDQMEKTP